MANRYAAAAEKLLAALGPESAIAGGVAVNAYGFARGTRDVDIISSVPLAVARRRLKAGGIASELRRGDPREGDFPCLKGIVGRGRSAVPFDVLPELVPVDLDKAVELDVDGHHFRVVDLETLARLKLKAGSIKDLYDVAILSHLHPDLRRRTEAMTAHDPELGRRLEALVADPRTQGQAREIRRQDKALEGVRRRHGRSAGRRRG